MQSTIQLKQTFYDENLLFFVRHLKRLQEASPFARLANKPFSAGDEDHTEDMGRALDEFETSSEDDEHISAERGFWSTVGTDLKRNNSLNALICQTGFTDFQTWWLDNLISESEDSDDERQAQQKHRINGPGLANANCMRHGVPKWNEGSGTPLLPWDT
eukprot:jgi/Botrbrau1/6182/Bobra.0344s0022.1